MAPTGPLEPRRGPTGSGGGPGGSGGGPGGPGGWPPGGPPPGPPRRRPRWLRYLVAALLLIPLVEIVVIIAIGQTIGGWWTFLLLLFWSLVGAVLVRREGARTWVALREALTTGKMPAKELADAALVLVGGALLLTPGFVTDAAGLFLILPFTRPLTRRWLQAAVERRLWRHTGVIRGDSSW